MTSLYFCKKITYVNQAEIITVRPERSGSDFRITGRREASGSARIIITQIRKPFDAQLGIQVLIPGDIEDTVRFCVAEPKLIARGGRYDRAPIRDIAVADQIGGGPRPPSAGKGSGPGSTSLKSRRL